MLFPREFGLKRIIVNNKTELLRLMNRCNKICVCNISLYKILDAKLWINCIYYDIDGKKAKRYMTNIHNVFMKENLKHSIKYSGEGYHVYLKCKEFITDISSYSAKMKIRYIQELYCKKAEIPINDGVDMDSHVVGNIRAMGRLPNTFNIKRGRYCIPVSDVNADHKKLAEHQCYDFREFGDNLLEDIKVPEEYIFKHKFDEIEYVADDDSKISPYIDLLPDSLKNNLHLCGWKQRFNLIIAFRQYGIPKNVGIKIAQKYWDKRKFMHCVYEERQFDYVYSREDLLMPSWDTYEYDGFKINRKDRKNKNL